MTRRDRLMILSVLAVVLLGGFWMLVISPQRKAATAAQGKLVTAQAALSQAQQKLSSGRAAQQAFRRDRTTIVKLGRVVPESDNIPTLITQLEALARRYDVVFSSFSVDTAGGGAAGAPPAAAATTTPQPSTATKSSGSTDAVAPLFPPASVPMSGGLGRTGILITLEGSYFNLERYLRAVQRFAVLSANHEQAKGRLVIIDGFSYKNKTKVGGDIEADLGASVYFAPPIATPSVSGSAAPAAGAPAPAAATSTPSTTGAAAVGGLR